MNRIVELAGEMVALAVVVIALGWLLLRTLKRSEDPPRLIFKWVLTALIVGLMKWKAIPFAGSGGRDSWLGVVLALLCGLVLTAIWRHSIASIVASPFGALYDGGDVEPEPHPAYSVAQSKQKQGKYLEAVAEIRKQLDRFPTDLEGHLMLARVQAEDLKDLPGAEITIHRLADQPGHAPRNIAYALYTMADWHLKIGQDPEAARRELEKIIELFPESEFALNAAQRIAHLGSMQMVLAPHERKKFEVPEGVHNLGLLKTQEHLRPAQADPGRLAADYVKHLERHPLDTEAREKLAVIYADHYRRLDLAADQLEQMIAQPHQPAKLVVRWLNLLADLQIRSEAAPEAVQQTLQRIVDRDPKAAAADIARNRLALLKLELRVKEKNQDVKLGSYEQNIGLKQGLPKL